jgi:hypothetical protein
MNPPECTGHSHDHDPVDELGLSLRKYVDMDRGKCSYLLLISCLSFRRYLRLTWPLFAASLNRKVTCLNEEVHGAGQSVLKLHDERLSSSPSLTSPDDDPELLLTIPFNEAVTVQSISIRNSGSSGACPRTIKLFTNRDDLDFETARDLPAQQELELLPPDHYVEGTIDYHCRPAGRFQNISMLTIFVVNNYNTDEPSSTEITYIGFKGKGTGAKRLTVDAVYETRGMKADHKVEGDEFAGHSLV